MKFVIATLFGAAALGATALVAAPQYAHAQPSAVQTSQQGWSPEAREAWIWRQLAAERKAGTISDDQYKTLSRDLTGIQRGVEDLEAQQGGLADDQKDGFNARLTAREAQLPQSAGSEALTAQK